ncbi:MAG: HEPN domain-containing protein [Candidatus Hydrogenedentota bacterium]
MNNRIVEQMRWIEQAKYDFDTARDLYEKQRYNWCCYLCQQASEKAVKAVYINRGEYVEKVHSIFVLIEGDKTYRINGIEELKNCSEQARRLDRYYIPTRYPNGVPYGVAYRYFGLKDAKNCMDDCETIILCVKKLLQIT